MVWRQELGHCGSKDLSELDVAICLLGFVAAIVDEGWCVWWSLFELGWMR